jgi:Cd2+/Zn2+-exporting ATPase
MLKQGIQAEQKSGEQGVERVIEGCSREFTAGVGGKCGDGHGCCGPKVAAVAVCEVNDQDHDHAHGHGCHEECSKEGHHHSGQIGESVCSHGKMVNHKAGCPSTGKRDACSCCGCDDEGEDEHHHHGHHGHENTAKNHHGDHDHDHDHGSHLSDLAPTVQVRRVRALDLDSEECCADGCCGEKVVGSNQPPESVVHDHDHAHHHVHSGDGDKGCCGGGRAGNSVTDDHDHAHPHGHGGGRYFDPDADESDCCADGCCGGGGDAAVGHISIDLDHNHDHSHGDCDTRLRECGSDDDCCADGCCVGGGDVHQVLDHDHSHSHKHSGSAPTETANLHYAQGVLEAEVLLPSIAVPTVSARVCSSCDPSSPVAHAVQVTRFRVANLCCAGEEKLIREALGKMTGVEHVAVNVIGRYAIVKHCPVECCAPGTEIMNVLNELRLGVSIHDVGDQDEKDNENSWSTESNVQMLHVGCVFGLFIAGLGMYLHPTTHGQSTWVFIASMALGLPPIAKAACISVFVRRCVDIHLLMIVAVCGAIAGKEYFDASLVVALFLTAELIEAAVMRHVQRAVSSSSASAMPKKAFLANGKSVDVVDLKIGDILAVRAGEMMVCDGVVVKGEGVVDESSLTGESVPITKKVGSSVLSGTVVQNGYVEVKLEKSPQDSTIRRLQQAVEDVQADKGQYAKFVDTFSQYWTPLVLLATFLLVVVGGAVSKDWWSFVNRGLVLLVLACPCAIVISAPIPAICAISVAARSGVLIRGSSVIEKMCTIDTVAVDKTGTLTKGKFVVVNRLLLTDTDEYDPMQLAVALEQRSTHPLANAVISDFCGCIAEAADMKLPDVKKVKTIDGVGIEGWVDVDRTWKPVMVGNERMLKQNGGLVECSKAQFNEIVAFSTKNSACVVLIVAVDDEVALLLALADEVRGESAAFVSTLHSMGLAVTMLTGDHQDVASQVCAELGIPPSECNSRLRTDQKLEWIKTAQHMFTDNADALAVVGGVTDPDASAVVLEEGRSVMMRSADSQKTKLRHVMMIGDGINDSTALAASTVGVAMGAGGTAMAVAAADVVLLNDNLMLLPLAVEICMSARRTIIQNCTIAVLIKVIAIVLAILGLLKFWAAVLVDIGALLIVVINGTKLLAYTTTSTTDKGAVYSRVPIVQEA